MLYALFFSFLCFQSLKSVVISLIVPTVHRVQLDYKLFPQHLWFEAFLSGHSGLVVVMKFFCHKVTGGKCPGSAQNAWRDCCSCFSAVIQLESPLAKILIAIKSVQRLYSLSILCIAPSSSSESFFEGC